MALHLRPKAKQEAERSYPWVRPAACVAGTALKAVGAAAAAVGHDVVAAVAAVAAGGSGPASADRYLGTAQVSCLHSRRTMMGPE